MHFCNNLCMICVTHVSTCRQVAGALNSGIVGAPELRLHVRTRLQKRLDLLLSWTPCSCDVGTHSICAYPVETTLHTSGPVPVRGATACSEVHVLPAVPPDFTRPTPASGAGFTVYMAQELHVPLVALGSSPWQKFEWVFDNLPAGMSVVDDPPSMCEGSAGMSGHGSPMGACCVKFYARPAWQGCSGCPATNETVASDDGFVCRASVQPGGGGGWMERSAERDCVSFAIVSDAHCVAAGGEWLDPSAFSGMGCPRDASSPSAAAAPHFVVAGGREGSEAGCWQRQRTLRWAPAWDQGGLDVEVCVSLRVEATGCEPLPALPETRRCFSFAVQRCVYAVQVCVRQRSCVVCAVCMSASM